MTEKVKVEKQKPNQTKQKRLQIKHRRNPKTSSWQFDEQELKNDIIREAKALGVPVGTAEVIAEKVAKLVAKWVNQRVTVTVDDINRRVALEIAKYQTDLAYVYQNRGKII